MGTSVLPFLFEKKLQAHARPKTATESKDSSTFLHQRMLSHLNRGQMKGIQPPKSTVTIC